MHKMQNKHKWWEKWFANKGKLDKTENKSGKKWENKNTPPKSM